MGRQTSVAAAKYVCVVECMYDFIIRKPLFFLWGGRVDVRGADSVAHCGEAAAWLDRIQRHHL